MSKKRVVLNVKCKRCGRDYVYDSRRRQGHNKTSCNSCTVNTRRFELKKKAVEYKGGKCEKCGYNKSYRSMVFHHPSSDKDFQISGSHCRSWESIKEELDKCNLLCANCHGEEHDKLFKFKWGGKMKTKQEIEKVIIALDTFGSKYPGMTYEQGVDEALRWVIEEITDEDFEFAV